MKVKIFKSIIAVVLTAVTITPVYSAINCDSKEDTTAKCGRLPNDNEYQRIKGQHSNLKDCEWSIIGEKDPKYNCHSYVIGDTTAKWQAVVIGSSGKIYDILPSPDGQGGVIWYKSMELLCNNDPNNKKNKEDITDYNEFFRNKMNLSPYDLSGDNYKQAKVLLWGDGSSFTHSSLKSNCECGGLSGWIMFKSKLHADEIIEHRYNHVNGYGSIKKCYK